MTPTPTPTAPHNPDPTAQAWCHGHLLFQPRTEFASAGKGDGQVRGRCKDWGKADKAVYDARRQLEIGPRLNAARTERRTPQQEVDRKRDRRFANLSVNNASAPDPTEQLGLTPGAKTTCFWCAQATTLDANIGAVMHVVSMADGGRTARPNLVPACWHCLSAKGRRDLRGWIDVLIAVNELPTHGALADLAAGGDLAALIRNAGWGVR